MLVNIQAHDDSISYIECLSQICFVSIFGGLEKKANKIMDRTMLGTLCFLYKHLEVRRVNDLFPHRGPCTLELN